MTLQPNATPPAVPDAVPIGPFVRHEILTRLESALTTARRDLPQQLDEVRDLVADVTTRLDALALSRVALPTDTAQPASILTRTPLATSGGEPVSAFLLIPFGEVTVERPISGDSFHFTTEHARAVVEWFSRMNRKLAIDYEHQSFAQRAARSDGLRPAAGWIGGLEVRDDGLWATDVTWTERAADLLRSGEYRYFSPVIFWADEDRLVVAALGPVALTNDPAMHGVQPLAAARELDDCEDVAVDEADEPAPPADQLLRDLALAQAEIEQLRGQLEGQAADAFIERGMRLGKITDATSMDWRDDFRRDPTEAELRLSRAPVLLPPGRIVSPDRRPAQTNPTTFGGAGDVDANDLAAFDRACAAGRVLGTPLHIGVRP
jgi:hypothetical protein